MQKPTLLTDALAYSQQYNLSVLPTTIKSKLPTIDSWAPLQKQIATELQIKKMFSNNGAGIAAIGGEVSGNLEAIDHDHNAEFYQAWKALVDQDCPGLVDRLILVKTQNNGLHNIYRCTEPVEENLKLAKKMIEVAGEGEHRYNHKKYKAKQIDGGWYIMPDIIETRGEGGYVLIPPTPGYVIKRGSFDDIPVITAGERAGLINCARCLNEFFDTSNAIRAPRKTKGDGTRPGDDFNQKHTVIDLIEPEGWQYTREGRKGPQYRRPGKDRGHSATVLEDGKLFHVFTDSDGIFKANQTYDAFACYALINHNGNFSEAARALKKQGYGSQTELATDTPQPSEIKIISLSDIEAKEFEDKPLIDEFLDEREGLGIIASGGLGKSLMVSQIALSCAVAKELFDLFEIREPFNTLIVQSENTMKATNKRVRGLLEAEPELKAGASRVFMASVNNDVRLTGALTNTDFQKKLVDLCGEAGARILALDPLISYHTEDENDNAAMRKALDCLTAVMDTAKVAAIVTHHAGKSKTAKMGRGASAIFDWAANWLVLEKLEGSQDTICVKHEKARNFELKPPFYLKRANFGFRRADWVFGNRENIKKAIATLQKMGGEAESKLAFARAFTQDHNLSTTTARNAIDAGHKSGVFRLWPGKGQATSYEFNTENIEKGYLNDVIEAAKMVFDKQGCKGVQEM
jgi:hypothetical protein